MRGMRSYAVRERLARFASSRRSENLEILSYDVAGHDNRTAVAVSHFIFGSVVRQPVNGGMKEYRYPGMIEKDGVVWLGQAAVCQVPQRPTGLRNYLEFKGIGSGAIP